MPNKNNINDLSKLIIEGIQNRKGRNISIVDMTHIEAAPVSRFIIAEGNSNMQVGAIADSVREFVLEKRRHPGTHIPARSTNPLQPRRPLERCRYNRYSGFRLIIPARKNYT